MSRRALAVAAAILIIAIVISGAHPQPEALAGEPTRRLPSAPRNFTGGSMSTQIKLTWDEPLDNGDSARIGFALLRGPNQDEMTVIKSDFGPFDFSYTDKGLNNGQFYFYGIKAINSEGVGEMSPVISVKPVGKATPPVNITYQYSSRRIDIQWLPPLSDGGDAIIGYYVLRGPNQDVNQLAVELGNVLEYTDTGVTNGVAYYYRLLAYTGYMNGSASDHFQVTPRGVPGPPGDLNVTPLDRKVHLNWTYPPDDGGGAVMGYHIKRGLSEDTMELYRYVSSRTEYLDDNITNGRYYHYSVAAVNQEGVGEWTDVIKVFPIGVPDSPLNLTIQPGDSSAILSWKPPVDDGGSGLIGYRIFRTTKGAPMVQIADVGLELTFTDGNLTNGDIYYYQVKAYNDQGDGYPSETIDAKPDLAPHPPENFRLIEMDSAIKLMWALPPLLLDYPVLEFRLYRALSGEDMELYVTLLPTQSIYEDRDLEVGVQHLYMLSAVSMIGEGQPTAIISGIPYTVPSLVQNLHLDAGNKVVTLRWDPPLLPGGRDIVNYRIFRGENIDTMSVIDVILGTLTMYNDTNVVNGISYYYSILAINEKAEGELHSPIEAEPLGPPDPPRNLVVSVKEGVILLEWEQPRANGGRTITGYVILRGPSQLNLTHYADTGYVRNFTDSDTEKGVTYYYAVKATNEIGEGKQSNFATGKIPIDEKVTKERDSALMYVIGGIAFLVLVIALIVVVVIMSRKKKDDEKEEAPVLEESDKEREHRLVMERRQQMKEYTDVALTTDEAHALDGRNRKLTYEELYGSGTTTGEVEKGPVPAGSDSEQPDYQPPTEGEVPRPAPVDEPGEEANPPGGEGQEYIPPNA
ncbi:MAG: fibronectin type III domain-containing protein [Candidatus Thermoplasmatota archaeon]|nr:fibronectin type III domain-containing protein [Candidatus Thermoplasmatota archaeon]